MKTTNLIQQARAKKQDSVVSFLKRAFNDFNYPVYLFGSYATGQFHGYSDADIVIIAPDALSTKIYGQACNQIAGLEINYDILIVNSINSLDETISSSMLSLLSSATSLELSKENKLTKKPPLSYKALGLHQAGMTLIEIMIALLIGAFLIGGVMEIFINSRQTYRMQEGLSRLQENGRFALDYLADDLRMAGFIGCNNKASLTNTTSPAYMPNTLNTPTAFLYNFSKPIEGFEATSATAWTPAINSAISSPQGGSDVVTIRRAADQGFTVMTQASVTAGLTLDTSATTTNLQTAGFLNSSGTNNCTLAVVNNCSSAAVFQVSSITGSVLSHSTGSGCTPDNSTNSLVTTFVGGQVYPINTISYFISTNPNNNLSIYRQAGSAGSQELIEGIEQMQILYGEDTDQDGSPNYYVSANNVVNMINVVSIRISLLAATLDNNLTAQPLAYTYNGATTTPTDNKIRRVFNTTIAIRN